MAELGLWQLVGLFFIIYNISWLVFLTRKHLWKVTTNAGHIFALNVFFTYAAYSFFLTLQMDFEALPSGNIMEILYNFVIQLLAVIGRLTNRNCTFPEDNGHENYGDKYSGTDYLSP